MSELKKGMLVQHVSLGLGKVVALESDAVHVFFETSDKRVATKLRLAAAEPLLSPATAKNAWLKGMSSFSQDPKTGRYGLVETWVTHDQAIARFLELFPGGFADPKHVGDGKKRRERENSWSAHQAFVQSLGAGEGERLLAGDEVDELVRRTLRLERHISVLHPGWDKALLRHGLQDRTVARSFFAALFEWLSPPAPDRRRFEQLASAVAALPQGEAPISSWPVVTLLPFVAQPDRHMFLHPKLTHEAAQRLGFELNYEATPSWPTYSALLSFADLLLDKLKPHGARDFIDVQSFIAVTATKGGRATGSLKASSSSPTAARARRPVRYAAT
jgi:hypothetical protein